MRIDVFEGLDAFRRLRANWEAVYDADPEAQFFLSWVWLHEWLKDDKTSWFVLAAQPDGRDDYVAFFPLRLKTKKNSNGIAVNEISFAGKGLSDYAGFICTPAHEADAIPAFARHLKRQNWARLNFDCLSASQQRQKLLLDAFSSKGFMFREMQNINKRDQINNNICPHLPLPDDWDAYLATLGSNTRQKFRRFLRKLDEGEEFRVTVAEDIEAAERDVDTLLDFWTAQWGERKGTRLAGLLRTNRTMLLRCFEQGVLFLPVLWQGDKPLTVLGSFNDTRKRALLFMIGGRDQAFQGPIPTGLALHAWSIRHAISQGYKSYDFLRGNEPYKYLFGATDRIIRHVIVRTRNGRNLGKVLDERSLPAVLKHAIAEHRQGKLAQAEIGYRQVLKVKPDSVQAHYGLGQLLAQKGNHVAAVRAFRRVIAIKPDSEKAWMRLAKSLEAAKRPADAAEAYQSLLDVKPDYLPAYKPLGTVLRKLGREREADAAFAAASNAGRPESAMMH